MRYLLVMLLSLSTLPSALAQVSVQFSLPGVSIGINQPSYPELVLVPGYPVYYDPSADSNYFFYDGMYWVYQGDSWYVSSWYDGPWGLVDSQVVPYFILRIPVRYYRRPPAYFRGWSPEGPPRWGERWGGDWDRQHHGWEQWNRREAPAPAPLPAYQKQYSGGRYPQAEHQQALHGQNYRYQPHDPTVKRASQAQVPHGGPSPAQGPTKAPPTTGRTQEKAAPPASRPAVHAQPAAPPAHVQPATGRQGKVERPEPPSGHQGKGGAPEPKRDPGQQKGEERGSERGR